jgi:hypothetical protein
MAKQSPARTKMMASQAKKAAAERRAEKAKRESVTAPVEVENDRYSELDGNWVAIGLAAPARRALIDDGLFTVSDLRKTSLAALKELPGMGPNAIRVLVAEMKKADLSFRK